MSTHTRIVTTLLTAVCLSVSCLAIAQDVSQPQYRANLLPFERMGAGAPAGWKVEGNNYSWNAETVEGPLGIGAARIELKGSGNVTLFSLARAMRAGFPHVVGLWLRSEPAGAKVSVQVADNDGKEEVAFKEVFVAESQWRFVSAQGLLPKGTKGRYFLELSAQGTDSTLWLDGLWLGERDATVAADWRPAVHAAGVALEPEAEWGVVAGDAPLKVKARVAGATQKGCRLRLHAVNTLGLTAELPSIALDDTGVWSGAFEIGGDISKAFGVIRVEATVVGPEGQELSPMSETLLARVPEPVPGPLPESYFGVHVALRERDVAAVARLGYKWCRVHDAMNITKWGFIEPEPDKWEWHDDDVAMLRRHGLSIVGMLDTAPTWHTGAEADGGYFSVYHAPTDLGLWRKYVRQVVGHYAGSIDEWEVWNEPWDMKRFFQGGSPQIYVELLKSAYEEAKAANPKSTIIGIDTYPPMWDTAVMLMGAYPYYDLLSWHRYDPTLQGRANDAISRVTERLRKGQEKWDASLFPASTMAPIEPPEIGKRPNFSKPTLCTEGGPDVTVFHGSFFSFADPVIVGDWSEGADRYARMFLSMIAAGNKRFIAYSVHNDPRYGYLTHMMAEPGFLLRPMHAALAALAHFVDGARYERRLTPAQDISAHVFRQSNAEKLGRFPISADSIDHAAAWETGNREASHFSSTVVVLAADGPEPENLPRPLPPGVDCFDRWGNPVPAPTQATRSLTYLVAAEGAREDLIRALQSETPAPETKPDVAALVDMTLSALTEGKPDLWTLFSAQGSLAVMSDGAESVTATRADLRADSSLAGKFRMPQGTQVTERAVQPAGPFTVGSFSLVSGDRKWAVAFVAAPDGSGGRWRYTSLTILPDAGQADAQKSESVTSVLKIWESAILEASTSKLYDTLRAGPSCLMAATLNGEYFMFANPVYLLAMMNTAVLWGPAATSRMSFSKVVIAGNVASLVGQWEVSSLAFGTAPYAITATLFEENGAWKIASMCASAE